jgi:hypothetical protein
MAISENYYKIMYRLEWKIYWISNVKSKILRVWNGTVPTENGNEHFVNIAFMVNKAKK